MPNTTVRAAAEGMPSINRRLFLRNSASLGAVAAVGAAPAVAEAATAPAENPDLVAAYDKLVAAKAEHAAAKDALEWLADEWRHRWPLAPEEILGGSNAHQHDYRGQAERDIIGRPLMRDTSVLTKRLSKKFREEESLNCFLIRSPDELAAELASWQNRPVVGRTEKAKAMRQAHRDRVVAERSRQLPLSRAYYAETKRLRELSGADALRQRARDAVTVIDRLEGKISRLPAYTMAGISIKAAMIKEAWEGRGIAELGGMVGDGYRLAASILDVLPVGSVS